MAGTTLFPAPPPRAGAGKVAVRVSGWDLETDFVSVGSGIGGLSGAIMAHDGGCEALVLEKAPVIGGATGYSYGQVWIPANPVMLAAGLSDSVEEGKKYLDFISGGYADPS